MGNELKTTEAELQDVWDQWDADAGPGKSNDQLKRLVEDLMRRKPDMKKAAAYGIATSILQKNGYMEGGEQTPRGLVREQFPEGRDGGKQYKKYIEGRKEAGDPTYKDD